MSKTAVIIEENRFGHYRRQIEAGYHEEVRRAAHAVEGRAKQLIIAWNAILTGDMYRSVGHTISGAGTEAEVYASVDYAIYVHDGTRHMRPRPFLTQAVVDMTPQVQQRLDRMIREGR